MKIEKNKIVFSSVLLVILIFLISYSLLVMKDDESEKENLKQTLVPELEEEQQQYESKLDAVNDLKEVKERNAPSIYDEKLIDSLGFYDPDFQEKEKERIVDSIYASGRISYSEKTYRNIGDKKKTIFEKVAVDSSEIWNELITASKEMDLEHQLFFATNPLPNEVMAMANTDEVIYVEVDGNQTVKTNYRLRMRLSKAAIINGKVVPKNTLIFGFISFQPNRALIEIENIGHQPTKLKAFDLADGNEGIYVVNSFRAEASTEVLDDIVQDINITGVPQVQGISRVFRRNQRNVKATIVNNYKLILKPKRAVNGGQFINPHL